MTITEIMQHPMHPHPKAEDAIPEGHVVVDLEAYVEFTGIPYKGKEPSNVMTKANIDEDALNQLLMEVSNRAKEVDNFEYGLPLTSEQARGYLREAVLRWLLKEGLL